MRGKLKLNWLIVSYLAYAKEIFIMQTEKLNVIS